MYLQTIISIVLNASVFLFVFAIGLKSTVHDATYLFRRPVKLIRALLAINVIMPLFAVVLVLIFDLTPVVKIVLVALSVSPIPPLLPMRMLKAGARRSYAVGIVVAASVLAIVFVPLAMEILEKVFNVPLQMTLASIAGLVFMTILLPIGLGVTVHSFVPDLAERFAKPILQIASIGLVVCLAAILFAASPGMWTLIGNGTVIALAAFVLVGLTIGHFLGGPEPVHRPALAFSTACRHPGFAVAIAHANFPEQKLAMAAVLLYLLINVAISIPYLLWVRRMQPDVEMRVEV